MSTADDRIIHETEERMRQHDEEVGKKKLELQKLDAEDQQLEADIDQKRKKLEANKLHRKTIEMDMKHLVDRQREDHIKLTRIVQESGESLDHHGVKTAPVRRSGGFW